MQFKKIEKNKFNVNDEFLQKIVLKYDLFKVKKLRLKNIFKNYDLFEVSFLTENIENLISDLEKSKTIYEFNIIKNVENNVLGESEIEMDNPDPLFEQQEALFKMQFPEAWDLTTGSHNIIVAIFDTGIDWYHPDMRDNIFINNEEMQNATIDWVNGQIYGDGIDNDGNGYVDDILGWDFKNNDNNPFIEDYHLGDSGDHGAKTSSVCGAVSNNGQFISGTNWNVSILGMKVDGSFYGWITNSIEAIDYCVGMGVNVINMSYGFSSWYNQTLFHQAIQDAYNNHNILFVSIAQNYNNETKVYPGAWPEVMALAATMLDDTKKSDSNYGDWVECTYPFGEIHL
ncbi:S8 family serine peptidase [Calditrichota bacterium GD2]